MALSYRLGKKSPRLGAVKLRFSEVFNEDLLPAPPVAFGHASPTYAWQLLANDRWGDCVWAGAAHETMLWNTSVGLSASFTDASVLSDYTAVAGFNPNDPNTDQGTDMADAAAYRRKTGVLDAAGNRHKIDSYVALRPGDAQQLAVAVYINGAAGVGIQLPASAMDQFDAGRPWEVIPGDRIEGGHYVACVGRTANGNLLVITWGRLQEMTQQFYTAYCDEALAYLSIENLKNNVSPEGFNLDYLRTCLNNLTGQKETMTMADKPAGTAIDPGKLAAVVAAVKGAVQPFTYMGVHIADHVSDDELTQVATAAIVAASDFDSGNSI